MAAGFEEIITADDPLIELKGRPRSPHKRSVIAKNTDSFIRPKVTTLSYPHLIPQRP